jgi:hypothetical protein
MASRSYIGENRVRPKKRWLWIISGAKRSQLRSFVRAANLDLCGPTTYSNFNSDRYAEPSSISHRFQRPNEEMCESRVRARRKMTIMNYCGSGSMGRKVRAEGFTESSYLRNLLFNTNLYLLHIEILLDRITFIFNKIITFFQIHLKPDILFIFYAMKNWI